MELLEDPTPPARVVRSFQHFGSSSNNIHLPFFLSFFLFLFLSVSPKRRRPTAVGWVGHGAIDRFGEKERKREREKESSMCPAITGAADCCCDGSIEGAFVMAQQQE